MGKIKGWMYEGWTAVGTEQEDGGLKDAMLTDSDGLSRGRDWDFDSEKDFNDYVKEHKSPNKQ